MVEKFGLSAARPISTPMEPNSQMSTKQCPATPNQSAKMQGVLYNEAIGSVLWLAVVSQPNTAYAIGILSQSMQNPGQAYWEALKRVIRYLGATKDLWLTLGGTKEKGQEGYCDADWASQEHQHSISGYSFHFSVGAVSWSSKKQNLVALSSTEAEYIAQTHAAKEAIWLKNFVSELQGEQMGPLMMCCDNQGAIALAKDNKFHARTKHINLRYHFIHEAVEDKKISLKYIPTDENVANIFTKALPRPKFEEFMEKLGLRTLEGKNKRQ